MIHSRSPASNPPPRPRAARMRRWAAAWLAAALTATAPAQAQVGLAQRQETLSKAQEGLTQELQALRAQVANLQRELQSYQTQEIVRRAHLACGTINAGLSAAGRSWDYGQAYRMTSPTTCAALCGDKENNHQCDGLVLIHGNQNSMTGARCDFTPPQTYFNPNDNVFCCCR